MRSGDTLEVVLWELSAGTEACNFCNDGGDLYS